MSIPRYENTHTVLCVCPHESAVFLHCSFLAFASLLICALPRLNTQPAKTAQKRTTQSHTPHSLQTTVTNPHKRPGAVRQPALCLVWVRPRRDNHQSLKMVRQQDVWSVVAEELSSPLAYDITY